MNNLITDFRDLVRTIEVADNQKGQQYSMHDTTGLMIICDKGNKSYYMITTILLSIKELTLYAQTSEFEPNDIMFSLIQYLAFNGDHTDASNKERFDKERTLFSIEKKKVLSDFFGVGEFMFNSANLKFRHHEFYYQIVIKKQRKNLGNRNKQTKKRNKK